MLRKEANEALQLLAQAFQKKFNTPLSVVSSYRSYIYQKGIKDR
jgi:LAS superfamily LD-carboxypeptidase LdcB